MEYDLNGGDKTGFNPYIKEGQICFDHRWLLLIGKRKTNPHLSRKRNFQFDEKIIGEKYGWKNLSRWINRF